MVRETPYGIKIKYVSALLVAIKLAAPAYAVTPEALDMEIKASDERTVLSKYYDSSEWVNHILPGIKSGAGPWLRIATQLRRNSDAGASEDIDFALYAAMPLRPFAVIEALGGANKKQTERICNISFEADLPSEGVFVYLNRIRTALLQAKTAHEKLLAAACRKGLIKAELQAKRDGLP